MKIILRRNDNIGAMRRAALDRAKLQREITKREKGRQGNGPLRTTWSLKLVKLKRSKGRPWNDSPFLATRTKNTKRLRFQDGGSGFKFPRRRDEGSTHTHTQDMAKLWQQTCHEQETRMRWMSSLDDLTWIATEIILIISKPFRFASIARTMKGTVIYLDRPSDIDFKCRVCKSKKWANVHGYSYRDLLIRPQKAFFPVHPNIGVKEKIWWEIF